MITAYELLGVTPDAQDEHIKHAYLVQVRKYPPDQDPEAFRRIRDAYEAIKDVRKRAEYAMFHEENVDLCDLVAPRLASGQAQRPELAQLLQAFKATLSSEKGGKS